MNRQNCWEVKKCGREPGGEKVNELGVCPAAIAENCDGINHGKNAGRYCWAISGTFSEDGVPVIFSRKLPKCLRCPFYLQVEQDEERSFIFLLDDFSI
jgi:hypothetical protein